MGTNYWVKPIVRFLFFYENLIEFFGINCSRGRRKRSRSRSEEREREDGGGDGRSGINSTFAMWLHLWPLHPTSPFYLLWPSWHWYILSHSTFFYMYFYFLQLIHHSCVSFYLGFHWLSFYFYSSTIWLDCLQDHEYF